jgi:lysine N6-hydroxylase
MANTELRSVEVSDGGIKLALYHNLLEEKFIHTTSALILATGYKSRYPDFISGIKDQLQFFDDGKFNVARNYSIDKEGKRFFVQNAELHTHGFSAPDLGLGPYRNATILNSILGREHFKLENRTAFQDFGLPDYFQRSTD